MIEYKSKLPTINIGIRENDNVIVPAIILSQMDKHMGHVIRRIKKQL
jgi:hypothetical protein